MIGVMGSIIYCMASSGFPIFSSQVWSPEGNFQKAHCNLQDSTSIKKLAPSHDMPWPRNWWLQWWALRFRWGSSLHGRATHPCGTWSTPLRTTRRRKSQRPRPGPAHRCCEWGANRRRIGSSASCQSKRSLGHRLRHTNSLSWRFFRKSGQVWPGREASDMIKFS